MWCTASTGCTPLMAITCCKVQNCALCSSVGLAMQYHILGDMSQNTLMVCVDVVNYKEDGAHVFALLQQDKVQSTSSKVYTG